MDHEIHKMNEKEKSEFRRDKLGIVFQSLFLIPSLTVIENVTLPLIVAGAPREAAVEKAHALLHQLHIGNRAHCPPSQLSKGQQQRVAIARAMINESKIIVCDEPTSALDQFTGSEVMNLLKELAMNHEKAVLVVTHDHRTFSYANRIIEMNDGAIKRDNP
jgi:putative ABC transport system ATP-binding protein